MKTVVVTGAAGFIGFHTAEALLKQGWKVVGIDSLEPYYDVRIKRKRLSLLRAYPKFRFYKVSIANYAPLERIVRKEKPHEIIHLAAQAGVRYSLKNPWAYAQSNYVGTLNVFEAAHRARLTRVIYASSSSVYGANTKQPFSESDRTDTQLSIYAASKKANESLAYAYYHMHGMEMVGLRFFTVFGHWDRPDLALFKFVRQILTGQTLELYNHGNMKRNFTHVSDIVAGIVRTIAKKPSSKYRLYNLGGSKSVPLTAYVELIEKNLNTVAKKRYIGMQAGDVKATVADTRLAKKELGYVPKVSIEDGVADYIQWFLNNKKFLLSLKNAQQ